jgi:phosphopantetheine adenylyltransferase
MGTSTTETIRIIDDLAKVSDEYLQKAKVSTIKNYTDRYIMVIRALDDAKIRLLKVL